MLMNMRAVGRSSAAFVPNRIAFRQKVALRTNRVVDFRLINTAPPKKTWTAASCLDDHAEVFMSLPAILGAYIGPNSLPPQLGERIAVRSRIARCAALHAGHVVMHACWGAGESIMVAVNSSNACPYCEGLHGELVRTSTRARARARARARNPPHRREWPASRAAHSCRRQRAWLTAPRWWTTLPWHSRAHLRRETAVVRCVDGLELECNLTP